MKASKLPAKRALLIGISEYQVFKEDPSVNPTDPDRVSPPFPSPSESAALTVASVPHPPSASPTALAAGDQRQHLQEAVQAVNSPTAHDSAASQIAKQHMPPPPSQWPRLDGPVNDVDIFESLLRDLGFCEMIILKNEQATRKAILFELEKIVKLTTVLILFNFILLHDSVLTILYYHVLVHVFVSNLYLHLIVCMYSVHLRIITEYNL